MLSFFVWQWLLPAYADGEVAFVTIGAKFKVESPSPPPPYAKGCGGSKRLADHRSSQPSVQRMNLSCLWDPFAGGAEGVSCEWVCLCAESGREDAEFVIPSVLLGSVLQSALASRSLSARDRWRVSSSIVCAANIVEYGRD